MAKASRFSICPSNVTFGNSDRVKVYAYDSSFLHKIVIKCGSYSKTLNRIKGDVETEFDVPMEWANAAPNSTSISGTLTLTTYQSDYSTVVGSNDVQTVTFNLAATAARPQLSVSVTDEDESITERYGAFLQLKSKLKVEITATGQYGATIKSYKTTLNGATYTSKSFTTNALTYNGSYTMTTTVVDSRGKATLVTTDINILPYAHPRIVSFSTFRSDAAGNASPNGAYLTAKVNYAISDVNGLNSSSYYVEYKKKGGSIWSILESGTGYAINKSIVSSGAVLDVNSSYDTRVVIVDDFKEVEALGSVGTAFKLIHYNKNGKALAFGKISEKEEGAEFGVPAFFDRPVIIGSEEKVLWSGNLLMDEAERAELTDLVTNQQNGIVLVFSRTENGTAEDNNFQHYFIPKVFIDQYRGYGNTFLLATSKFGVIATKYLYVNDAYITGHADNDFAGTTNGVTFNNAGFCLRYVVGV